MGEVRVPADAKWRAQTQRAVENFPISGGRLERSQIEALARIKGAVASVKRELGHDRRRPGRRDHRLADEVARGDHDDQFPIDVFQTGSGTSSNMNMNEVLATLAGERLGGGAPERRRQPSHVVERHVPASIHIAATAGVLRDLVPALEHLAAALERKATSSPMSSSRAAPTSWTRRRSPSARSSAATRPRCGSASSASTPPAAGRRAAARRDGGRHRHQRAAGLRRPGHRAGRGGDRPAAHRGPRSLRGAGRPRRPGRALRGSCARSRSA
jgi:hypothetical protein